MLRIALLIPVIIALSPASAMGQTPSSAVVAIASGPKLTLYDASGTVVQRIDLERPIAGFDFSPDRTRLVVVSPETEHGGSLFMIDLKTGVRKKLTAGHFAFKHLNKGEAEVYDSPAFSPDGKSLAFAVHGNQPGYGNDAWENSGPIGVIDLATGKIHVLKATNNIDGNGPCSESDPQWSPDGKWILFNCEDGAFITDAQGMVLRDLKLSSENAGSSAAGWVSSHCVLYVQTPVRQGNFDFDHEAVKVVELNSMRSFDAGAILSGLGHREGGIQRASGAAMIRQTDSSMIVATREREWVLPLGRGGREPQTVAAQLLTGWDANAIPDVCR